MHSDDDDITHNVALFGISGALGREVQAELEAEHEGIEELIPVAGLRSAGQTVRWRGRTLSVLAAADVAPSDVDFAIFATPAETVSREAPRLLDAGARVIDASGVLASPPLPRALAHPAPVVWPHLSSFPSVDLDTAIALTLPSPAASTMASLLDAVTLPVSGMPRLAAVTATVLLSASHAGRDGIDALSRQSVGLLNHRPALDPRPFPEVLSFNAVAPAPGDAVLFEAQAVDELRRLVPALGAVPITLQPVWIAAFSGLVVTLELRFDAPVDAATLARLVAVHPDLDDGSASRDTADADLAPEDTLDEDDALDEDASAPEAAPADTSLAPSDALSLRDVVDQDQVRVGPPTLGDGTVRLTLMADPLHRTALAVSTLLSRWMSILAAP